MSEKHVKLCSRAYRPGGLVVYRQRTMDPASECVSIGIRRNMPSPHRWHGDVSRGQHEPVASTEAGHQRQLSKWLVGCAGFYRRGHAKRERPHYWMRELPVHAIILRVCGAAGWTSGCHRRRIQQSVLRVWTNIGFMYDPVANTWSAQITLPGTWCCAGGGGTGAIGDAQSTILTNGTMLVANIGSRYRVVQSRDADLQCTRPDGQGRHQQRGRLESTAERDIPDCRFKDPIVLRNLRFRDQLVGERSDPPW